MMKKGTGFLTVLVISIVLALLAITPPRPKSAESAADEFSSGRAMADLRIIAAAPHPTGSPENANVRAFLQQRLTELGLEVSLDKGALDDRSLSRLNRWSGGNKTEQELYNIIGIRRGADSSLPALLLMAHYDTVWGSPGAADDTIGLAAILEVLRALNIDGEAARDVIVLFTDAEELGLVGARHFFENHRLKDHIGVVINLEARGGGGTANLFQTSKGNGDLARVYARAAMRPSASSLSTFVYDILPNDTDMTPALKKDYIAYNIANIGRAEYYHSPKIIADALDEATLQHMGMQVLGLTRALIKAGGVPLASKDAVFFDVFGQFMLVYAPVWGWVFLALGLVFYAASIDGRWRGRDIGWGSLKMIIFLGSGALLYGLDRISGNGGNANYYDRLAAIPKLESLAFLFIFAVAGVVFGRKATSVNMRLGASLPLCLIGIAGQAIAPTATYFISLPFMLCAIVALAVSRKKVILAVIPAALTVGYMLSLGHLLMLGVGGQLLFVVMLPAALAALALLPLIPENRGYINRAVIMIGLFGAAGFALWVRFDPIAVTVPLY